jgi:ketosteroid isomerase-like protein
MSAKENKAILQRLFKEFNQGNLNVLDELFAEDFVDRYPVPGETPNKEGFKQFLAGTHKTFPDWHWSLEDIIAEGDKVAYHWQRGKLSWGWYTPFCQR